MKIVIINGPNLNLLGKREPGRYGTESFAERLEVLRKLYPDLTIDYFQSNIEGEIILNPGGYTHTSVAIADAVASVKSPVIEVHITNVAAREEFRHNSLVGRYCSGSIIGLGLDGYRLAIEALREINRNLKNQA